MRTKNKSVKINNLCQEIKEKLPNLDGLVKRFTEKELVITSGNDSIHWGSRPKPKDWQAWTIEQIREYSNSLHYKDRAIDIRTWRIYALPKDEQVRFIRAMRKIFPKPNYDIVREPDHIHIEFDPKPIEPQRIDFRKKKIEVAPEIIGEVKEPRLPVLDLKVPFYYRRGFKRITGSIIFITGTILSIIPKTKAVGAVLLELGGILGLVGVGHATVRARKEGRKTFIDILIEFLQNIIDWLKSKIKKS